MNDTESLITDALRLRAEQAPPEGNVLAALYRPRRSRKPLFLAITAATAAAAVAVVTTTVGRPSADVRVGGQVATTTAATSAQAGPKGTLTRGSSPTWLPEDFVERSRVIEPGSHTERHWALRGNAGQSTHPMLTFHIEHTEEGKGRLRDEIVNAVPADRVTVNGMPAVVIDAIEESDEVPDVKLVFQPDGSESYAWILLRNMPDARAAALRIAQSVRPDVVPQRVPLSVGDSKVYSVTADEQGDWIASADGTIDGVGYSATLRNTRATALKGDYGVAPQPVTARGLPAEYLGTGNGYLTIQLNPNAFLLVAGEGPETTPVGKLVAAAEAIVVDPNPDVSWAGA